MFCSTEKSDSSKNEWDSGLLLSSVQLLLWSLDIYSPEGRPEGCRLNTSQTQHSAPRAFKSIALSCHSQPGRIWVSRSVPPLRCPLECITCHRLWQPGQKEWAVSDVMFSPTLASWPAVSFSLQMVLRWLIPIRYISAGVTSMMNDPAAIYTVYIYMWNGAGCGLITESTRLANIQ